jgi:hypothetical protein
VTRGALARITTPEMIMSEPHMTFRRFFCGKQFERDNHVYHGGIVGYRGKYVGRYMIEVCDACYASNLNGWAPCYEAPLVAHLSAKGLPIPDRN